jgi:hypothetical protein
MNDLFIAGLIIAGIFFIIIITEIIRGNIDHYEVPKYWISQQEIKNRIIQHQQKIKKERENEIIPTL